MKNMVDVRRSYQDSVVQGATPLELVICLYDVAIQDMRRALAAMKAGDVERRTAEVGHALMVLQQLQGTLDFERGGGAARQFEQFYNLVRAKLLEAQMRCSPELLQEQVRYLSEVRDCWAQARRMLQPSAPVVPASAEGSRKSEWSA
jgi:flagellar protein FliS